MCLGVWQRISQPPILQLNAEHPPGDGFGSLQNGKSIFAKGVISGLGVEKFCAERGGCACVTSRGEKFCIFFHCLFVYAVYWENMNGSIFIRGAVQGKTWGWEECFLMSACRLGGWVENLFSWNCLFLYWTVNYCSSHSSISLSVIHSQAYALFIFPSFPFFFFFLQQRQWSFPWKTGASV